MRGFRGGVLVSSLVTIALVFVGVGSAQARVAADDLRPGAEAKFVQIDPITYDLTVRKKGSADVVVPFTTTMSKLFYTFQPADVSPETAPLFIFLNGGPGAATTANFFANNTAPYTVNLGAVGNDPAGVVKNPDSWTKVANLLYIDPSQSGFSYNVSQDVVDDPEYDRVRAGLYNEYWARGNLNPFIDADQILRVILTFFKEHQEFAGREVVMVGESYGGVRVSTILYMLMHSGMYDTGGSSFFHDPGLAAMIREHFATGQSAPTIEQVTKQFDRQILVQPQLSSHQGEVQGEMYWDKDPSIIDKVAKDAHSRWGFTRWWPRCLAHLPPMPSKSLCPIMVYLPQWGRDRYDYAMPDDYSDKQDAYANKALRKVDILRKMLGVEPASIKGLAPLDRTYAYKTMGNPEPGEDSWSSKDKNTLVGLLGPLPAPDSYYVSWNQSAYLAATIGIGSYTRNNLPLSPDSDELYGDMFLENLHHVKTFLTDADRDLVIYSKALPAALARHDGVQGVIWEEENPSAQGWMTVKWQTSSTTITWPRYEYAGHAVAMTMPGKLLKDVTKWMTGGASAAMTYAQWTPGTKRLKALKAAGVKVRLHMPAATVKKAWLFGVKAPDGSNVSATGTMRWHHGKRSVVVKQMVVAPKSVTARVGGEQVRLLSKKGTSVRLTAAGARAMNAELKASLFTAKQPMGRVQIKP